MADEFLKHMDERFEHVNQRFDHVNERFNHLNGLADQHLQGIHQRFDDVQRRMQQGFAHVNQRFDELRAEVRSLRTIMFTLYVPIVVAVVGGMVKVLFFSN